VKLKIGKNDADGMTAYTIGTRVFEVQNLVITRSDKLVATLIDLYGQAGDWFQENADKITHLDLVHLAFVHGAGHIAGLWNFLTQAEDKIDGDWISDSLTIPQVREIATRVVEDNGMKEVVAEALPFYIGLIKARGFAHAAVDAHKRALELDPGLSTTNSDSPTDGRDLGSETTSPTET